ncbi:ImmA/IrrE family metallo-endopeptidase [Streptomyces sp. NBC_01244]|uniref:ImmA/IrrE family metallo-endopeptidase n=1 Tax=Streptomyces sp. NBC_01244 TaxID=2903797 RepID=UPI002E0F6C50|nr:ImmA/IrrE family metallo-endopeptidase [Streptomyces sp. NBC_01244]
MSWNDAHGVAMIAAAQAHKDLSVAHEAGYVDVFGSLRAEGIDVMGRGLGGLLGLYVDASEGGPACLINVGLEEVSMRHTAAHELGHHRLGHGTSYDHKDQEVGRWGEGWPQHERDAEAFASWFLMPRPVARAALARCGLTDRPGSPHDVYRMARWMGTPYATTVRHLVRLKMIDRSTETLWLKHSPGALKAELAGSLPLAPKAHLHVLTPSAHRATVYAAVGDCLLLQIPGGSFDHLPLGLSTTLPEVSGQISLLDLPDALPQVQAVWVGEELHGACTLTATAASSPDLFHLIVRRTPDRQGSDYYRD